MKKKKERTPSMKKKLILALGSVAVLLSLSGVISIIEYRRMSNHMSDLIASNVSGINNSQKLYDMTQQYNNGMLSVVTMDDISFLPTFEADSFKEQVEKLREHTSEDVIPVLDSVKTSFSDYIKSSADLTAVFHADSIDTPKWFFDNLQPKYHELCNNINILKGAIHADLRKNTTDFDAGFYRSIIPGVVSMCAALMLIFLLLYYILVYYVNPIYRMSAGVDNYRQSGKRYGCEFDGDDQLANINNGLTDVIEENIELKGRLRAIREERTGL